MRRWIKKSKCEPSSLLFFVCFVFIFNCLSSLFLVFISIFSYRIGFYCNCIANTHTHTRATRDSFYDCKKRNDRKEWKPKCIWSNSILLFGIVKTASSSFVDFISFVCRFIFRINNSRVVRIANITWVFT